MNPHASLGRHWEAWVVETARLLARNFPTLRARYKTGAGRLSALIFLQAKGEERSAFFERAAISIVVKNAGEVDFGGKAMGESIKGKIWIADDLYDATRDLVRALQRVNVARNDTGLSAGAAGATRKIVATSFERYNGGIRVKRAHGSSTVTRFYVHFADEEHDPSKWKKVEGFGPTPGDRKTDAIRRSGLLEGG